jgi:hypothetical protein
VELPGCELYDSFSVSRPHGASILAVGFGKIR